MDVILIFAPAIVATLSPLRRSAKAVSFFVIGFVPFFIWELFSLFYYGFPFPNTAYAKLNTGIAAGKLIKQGFIYLIHSLITDPVTLIIVITGILISFFTKNKHHIPVAIGIVLFFRFHDNFTG